MHLAGPAMWWMPDWLERRLPRLAIEADEHPDAGAETPADRDRKLTRA
jgi:RND superfamily putative drug exporter